MGLRKLHHVGIVVEDLRRAIDKFVGFGFACKEVRNLKDAGVTIAFFPVASSLVELLYFEPEKRNAALGSERAGINHICFEVDDLEAGIRDFEANGARLMEGFPRMSGDSRMAFFYPETTENVLIEILQE
jgi:methylmalonyl-CoA epimerase